MFDELEPPRRYPRVPMDRRVAAFAVDFGLVSLFSLFGGSHLYIWFFMLLWLGLRVVVVEKNRGQSLGQWAFDIRVAELRYGSTPTLQAMLKREAIAGLGALLVFVGLVNLSPTNGFILIGLVPLLVDCGFAFLDEVGRQALHDRVAHTMLVQTRRGYSLDIKLKKLFAQRR
ncbi:RDD family protein [Leptothermofonsia sichuanensis E412]|jgi:uncharacterized RDD family membrane protein YckC|uniref:RDD family protein n=1 Tax=Leptothermofonsia sichuanensis TaxID=2917832 RepID=UPI001CA77ABE|nr:RDD family protein [Leptothermofonsia sichuanensis]QZZ20373.1 RDD family protein [Leptothermofonsia sichuanensis E412]